LTLGDSDSVLFVGRAAVLAAVAVGDLAHDLGRGAVDLANEVLGGKVRLADRIGVESVGGEDLGARVGEAFTDRPDDLGTREVQEVIVAALVLRKVERAAIIGLLQPPLLHLRSIGAVLDQDSSGRFGAEAIGCGHDFARTPSK
jgi:hypothetical protein